MRIYVEKMSAILFAVALGSVGLAFAGENTHSGRAVDDAAQSSGNASGSAAHSIAASGQVTSAAVAVPLSVGGVVLGTAGAASVGSANDSMRAATSPVGKPLEITDETITVMPPNEALKNKKESKPNI